MAIRHGLFIERERWGFFREMAEDGKKDVAYVGPGYIGSWVVCFGSYLNDFGDFEQRMYDPFAEDLLVDYSLVNW